MPGGKAPKRKGTRAERLAVQALREAGLEARRVPASGNARAGWAYDLEVEIPGNGRLPVEVKARRRFGLEAWLPEGGLLILKPDRKPALVVLPLDVFLEMVKR